MRTIYWFTSFWIHTFYTTLFIPRVNKLIKQGLLEEKRQLVHRVAQSWAKGAIDRTGSRIEIEGLENIPKEGAVLFTSNHQGNFDIPILLAHLPKPIGFVAKIELTKLPIVSKWMALMECVFIDRKDMRQSLRAITKSIDILKSGQSMVIFPEGTRSKSSEMDAFKPGSLKMATKAGVPIVPITINGSYKLLEANNNRIAPGVVKIIISPPIEATAVDKSTDLTALTFNIIKSHLHQ